MARAKRVRGATAVYKEDSDSEPEEDKKVQREKSKKVVERKEDKKEKSKSGKKEVKSGAKKEETGTDTKGEKEKSGVKEKSGRGKKGRAEKSGQLKTEEEDEPRMKSVMVKGAAPVDSECPVAEAHHVYSEKSGVWDAMLNQTNIQNNNNKFYMIQLLESDSGRSFGVWMRWGRVGVRGQTNWQPVGGLEEAKRIFKVKFQDKTRNNWEEREVFEKVAGKYDLVSVDYCQDETDRAVAAAVKEEPVASVLAQEVQDLVSLVCSLQTMERAVMEMQYDTRKAPLGKLTKDQITAGYKALKLISDCVEAGRTSGRDLVDACNDFYTRIPHAFGMRTPPLVTTREEVKGKLQLLEALGDIQVALKLLGSIQQSGNVVDQRYRQLQCSMEPVGEGAVRQLVIKSILSTHAQSHSLYSMEVQQVGLLLLLLPLLLMLLLLVLLPTLLLLTLLLVQLLVLLLLLTLNSCSCLTVLFWSTRLFHPNPGIFSGQVVGDGELPGLREQAAALPRQVSEVQAASGSLANFKHIGLN